MDKIKIIISVFGSFLNSALGWVFFYLIREFFNISLVADYGVILSFLGIFSFIADLGFATAHLKFYPQSKNEIDKGINNGTFLFFRIIQYFIYTTIVFTFFFFFNTKFSFSLFFIFFLGELLRVISYNLFFFILLSEKQVSKKLIISLTIVFFKIIILIILILNFQNNLYILGIDILCSRILLFTILLFIIRKFKFLMATLNSIKKYIIFSLPYFIITTTNIVTINIDIIFLELWYDPLDVANYFTAKEIYTFINSMLISIGYVILPSFSSKISDNKQIKKDITKLHKFLNIFLFLLFIIVSNLGNFLINLVFGSEYDKSSLLLSFLVFYLCLSTLDQGIRIYLQSIGNLKMLAFIMVSQNFLTVLLMYFFISPDFFNLGALGCGLGLILGNIIIQIIYRPLIYLKYKIGFYWGFFRNFILSIFLIFIHYIIIKYISINYFIFSVLFLFYFLFYFLMLYLTKGLNIKDLKFILNTFNPKIIMKTVNSEFKKN